MQRFTRKLKAAWADDFARQNAILFGGTVVVSFMNYLYYPVLGRLLGTAQFGEVQALVSVFLQATLFVGVIANVSVNVVANEPDESVRSRFTHEMSRIVTGVSLLAVAMSLVFVGPIERFLRFDSPLPFLLLGATLVAAAATALQAAYLRGRSAFGSLSVSNFIAAGGKLLVSAGLVALGWGTAGAIGGLLAAQAVSFAYTWRATRLLGMKPAEAGAWRQKPDVSVIKPHLAYTGLVLIVSLATTALFSVDSLIIKHYFDATTAGEYGGVATIARIIYFLTGSVAMVLLSSVKLQADPKHNRRLLMRSGLVQVALGGAVLLAFTLMPRFIIQLLLGARYLPLAHLLPPLGLAMFLLAMVNLVFSYDLALRRKSVALYAISGVVITAGVISLHHDSPSHVVDGLLIGAISMLLLRGLDSLRRIKSK